MEMYKLLLLSILNMDIVVSTGKETINLLHITTDTRFSFDLNPMLDYALAIVNSRQDILPNHHVNSYTYSIGDVSL